VPGPTTKSRCIVFYLPQYHPIPENDAWWGIGFTEWTNVASAQPLFRGHYQPRIPADLGFYDLRLPEARLAQAELASTYGIEGFCYWHYWFHGKRLLERPFNEVLASGEPRFPFCLAWANETWSRRWLGEERDILLQQTYSSEDDLDHARWLTHAFSDPRYVRVHGRPLFLIYRPADLPNPHRTTELFRREAIKHGLPEPFLLGSNAHCANVDCRDLGFDGTLNFEPQLGVLPDFMYDGPKLSKLRRNLAIGMPSATLKLYDYTAARRLMASVRRCFPVYPCVVVGWDNTPRRGAHAIVLLNSTPERFKSGLSQAIDSILDKPFEERLVFINAWNEWAEGNTVEPDLRYGRGHLEAIRRANASPALES
jgi:lipopolysaccharide biosynthesis protein